MQRLTQVVNKKTGGADLNKFSYAYDNRDVRTGVQMKYGADPLRQVNYSYDSVDQLVGEAATGGVAGSNYSNAFSYDAMGNRLRRENTQGTTTSMTRSGVNELNQLTSVSTSVDGGPRVTGGMSYDAAGNLTETTGVGGARTLYVYDDADRLFRIEKRDAADVLVSKSEFVYDYASRKSVSQEFTYTAGAWVKGSEKRRVFDGLDVVQERDELNQVTAQLVRNGNIGGILSRSTSAGASFYGYDGGGNVTLLTDASGNEVGRYRYDAFGNTLEIAGTRAAENPYRFSTKELHGASGLYDFGYRFYSASLGRWINRDPIQEDGGINLYAMVENDPVNSWDLYGENRFYQWIYQIGTTPAAQRIGPAVTRFFSRGGNNAATQRAAQQAAQQAQRAAQVAARSNALKLRSQQLNSICGYSKSWTSMSKAEQGAFQHSYTRHAREFGLPNWSATNADKLRNQFNSVITYVRNNAHTATVEKRKFGIKGSGNAGTMIQVRHFRYTDAAGTNYFFYETFAGRFISAGKG